MKRLHNSKQKVFTGQMFFRGRTPFWSDMSLEQWLTKHEECEIESLILDLTIQYECRACREWYWDEKTED